MKKFFTLAALLASCWCSSSAAVYTDVIDYDNLKTKSQLVGATPSVSTNLDDLYNSYSSLINSDMYSMYSGESESGAHYSVVNVFLFDTTSEMYTKRTIGFPWDSGTNGNGIHNVVAPEDKWIKSISASSGWQFSDYSPLTVFYSADPFKFEDRYNPGVGKKELKGSETVTAEFEEPAQYVYIVCNEKWIYDVTIEWTDVKPVPTVATPVITCNDNPVIPGSYVYVKTATIGATIDVKVTINGVEDGVERKFTQESEWGQGSFQLPGNPNDVITVTAVATKTDWVDSETATQTYTLSYPPCPNTMVNGQEWNQYFISGEPVTFAVAKMDESGQPVAVEGAQITYSWTWNNWDTGESGSSTGETTVDSPYAFVIPTEIPVGATLNFTFKQVAPNYSESTSHASANVVSKKLAVPTLNKEKYTDVVKGTAMSLMKPNYAALLHFTINGGEEQTAEWQYDFTVEENMTIEAWATGEAPFETSDKVTYEITLENLTPNIDVILPEDSRDDVYKNHPYTGSEHNGAINYMYYGGYWYHWDGGRSTFYQNQNVFESFNFVANLTAGEYEITDIRIDCPNDGMYGDMAAVYLADEPLVTVTEDGTIYRDEGCMRNDENYVVTGRPGYFVICSPEHESLKSDVPFLCAGNFNEWINLKTASEMQIEEGFVDEDQPELSFEHRKFFLIRPWTQSLSAFRYMIRYNSPETGVTAVNADLDTEEQAVYYNLNGVRVDGKLTPGLYIRVTPASSSKVLVK